MGSSLLLAVTKEATSQPVFIFALEVVGFLLTLAVVAKFPLPLLRKAMKDRANNIRNSIEAAEQARADAERLVAERCELLEVARQEAGTILDQANQMAEQRLEEGRQRRQEEFERLVHAAQAEIAGQLQQARAEITAEVGALVLRAAEGVIEAALDEERHRALVDEAITAAEASDAAG